MERFHKELYCAVSRLPILVCLATFLVLILRAAAMARAWKKGRPATARLLRGFIEFHRRYLNDVHHVVAREPSSARMHALLVGGFLGALSFFLASLALPAVSFLPALVLGCLIFMLAGLRLEFQRRADPPVRLSRGSYQRLPILFALALAFMGLTASSSFVALPNGIDLALTLAANLAGLVGLGGLAWLAGTGPMRHAVAGAIYLVAHPRPERFGQGRSTGLRPVELGAARLGARTAEDFQWPQLASFDACVQCGRCEVACPAFAAGQPLNPKKLINDLAVASRGTGQLSYHGNPHPGRCPDLPELSPGMDLIARDDAPGLSPDTIYACTTCRACVEACPMMIEHVDAVIDLRRSEVLNEGRLAGQAQVAVENLRQTGTLSGEALDARFDFATDLAIPVLSETGYADMLLWVGEAAFDRRAQRTIRALVKLLKHAGIDFAILGAEEQDCGDQARRLGDEATFQFLACANIETLSRYRFDTIVTADPHAMHVLRNEYPAFGGHYRVRHHTDVLAELLDRGALLPSGRHEGRITYHDPCYLARYNGEIEAPRRILAALGGDFVEMERSGLKSHCCGGGGAAPLTDIPGERRIPDMRMAQASATGAHCVAVACPGCTAMLEGVAGTRADVRDLAELLWDRVDGASA
ncbi:DUF3483 domain-containing protein [Fulvimarina manganoxydans]